MDMNNDFFGDIKRDEFEEETISNSGINYGEHQPKSSTRTILIAIGAGAIFAGALVLMLGSSSKENDVNNLADIPTISSPSESIKIVPEEVKLNEVFEQASIYTPTKIEEEKKLPKVEKKIVKTKPLPKIKPKKAKEPVKPVVIKKENKPEIKLIEKTTNVKGEVEVSPLQAGGPWNVQITSTGSEAAAKKEWTSLTAKHPEILKGLSHTINKTNVDGKVYYRLRVSGLENSTIATEICDKLKAKSVSCFVTK